MTRVLQAFVVLTVFSGIGFGQTAEGLKIKVGDPVLNGKSLQPYTNEWRVSLRTPAGKETANAATWKDELKPVTRNGVACLERIQRATFRKDGKIAGTTETVNVFSRQTLAPVSRSYIRHASEPGQEENTRLEFDGLSVHLRQDSNGRVTDRNVQMSQLVFDFYGGMYGLLFAALPLRSGLHGELPSINESEPTMAWVPFTVTGQVQADAGSKGKLDTWVVESNTNLGPMKFWISKEAPYIIRLEFSDKSNGMKWTYSMV
jgi:hypothetical protein